MPAPKKPQNDQAIARLTVIVRSLGEMDPREREATMRYLVARYGQNDCIECGVRLP